MTTPTEPCVIATSSAHNFYNHLQDPTGNKIIYDLRPEAQYKEKKIRTAVSLPLHGLVNESASLSEPVSSAIKDFMEVPLELATQAKAKEIFQILSQQLPGLNRRTLTRAVLLYDGDKNSSIAATLARWLAVEGHVKKVYILGPGFDHFEKKYPFMCSTSEKPALGGLLPSEIVEDFLYLGSFENAKKKETLGALNITHIVNMADELDNVFEGELNYIKLGIEDTVNTNIIDVLDSAMRFMEEAKEKNSKVLVHCAMGISRSSAVTIAYLMKANGWSFEQAFNYVKEKRPCINPNPGFRRQLGSTWEEVHKKSEEALQ